MKRQKTQIDIFIEKMLSLGKPTIAFGMKEPNQEILKSLRKGKKYAHIILVGPKEISSVKGFKKIISNTPEEEIIELLVGGKIDGIIRGTIDSLLTSEIYSKQVNLKKSPITLALMEDAHRRQFFLSEGSNPKGWERKEKVESALYIANFLKDELGIKPKVGFITGIRHHTFKRKKSEKSEPTRYLVQTYKDAEYGVRYLKKKEIEAFNYAIELGTAVKDGCNIIVPPNGMVGNQIARALIFLGNGRLLTGSHVGIPHSFEDNSRNETDFEFRVKWLAARINKKRFK